MALLLLLLLSPVGLIISLVLLLHNQPVLFKHTRPGVNGVLFQVYKFTTMDGMENPTPFLFGRFLRKTSLDELPQLINIIRGEMSFVGPRPLLVEYLHAYTGQQCLRHLVKPGITGWAQVNGRNSLPFNQKVALDVYYAQNLSFNLDTKIMIKTFIQLTKWDEADYHDVILSEQSVTEVG